MGSGKEFRRSRADILNFRENLDAFNLNVFHSKEVNLPTTLPVKFEKIVGICLFYFFLCFGRFEFLSRGW